MKKSLNKAKSCTKDAKHALSGACKRLGLPAYSSIKLM